jgi:DNA polymerase III subunit delta'
MFGNLTGNEKVKDLLRRLKAAQRIPNAMLLVGPEGVGKKQFALELARSVICHSPNEGEPCESCTACLRSRQLNLPDSEKKEDYQSVNFSGHPDLGFIVAHNKNILVDAIRSLENEANYRPYEAEGRFFIIDDAHKMNDAASNALLKTLEEPPSTTHIFLVTSKPDALLSTIRSRCQTVRFSPLTSAEISVHLSRSGTHSGEESELVARLSDGSIARALGIEMESFIPQREKMLKVLESAIVTADRLTLLKIAEEMNDAKNKEDFESSLSILETLIRDVWVLSIGGRRDRLVNTDIIDALVRLAGAGDPKLFPEWILRIEEFRGAMRVNINKKIATNSLFMEMVNR